MKRFRLALAISVLFMLAVGGAVWAQADFPAYLAVNGHLYRWTPADGLVQMEACEVWDTRVMRLSASPDGRYLALNLVTEAFFTEGGAPTPHGDLYWCDPVNDVVRQLTQRNQNNTSTALRGTWSPDGSRLGWSEVNPDFNTAAIRTFDPAADEIITLVESTPLSYACGSGANPPKISWSSAGIAVTYWMSSAADVCLSERLGVYVYDGTTGALIADLPLGETGGIAHLDTVMWVTGSGEQMLVTQGQTRYLVALDGTVTEASGGIEWALAGDEAIRPYLPFTGSALGVSRDGRAALILIETNLYTVLDGAIGEVSLMTVEPEIRSLNYGQDIAWAALRPQVTASAANSRCSIVKPIFYGDNPARVISGMGANNLRFAPFADAELIGEIPEGGEMQVVFRTHICNDGVVWRYVSYEGMTGWTAESQGPTAYLERLSE